MNKREFLIGSAALAAVAPFAAMAKPPSTDDGWVECPVSVHDGRTYSTVTGKYRRIGNMVEFALPRFPLPAGPITIGGLPFAA